MELSQYFRIVFRWWWLILCCTSIAGGISYYVSLKQPRIYQASTTLMVGQVLQEANPSGQDFALVGQIAESYAQIGRRQPVLQATIDSLGLEISWQSLVGQVYIQPLPRTQLLQIYVTHTSPDLARLISDEIARQLILQSPTSPQNQERQQRSKFVQSQLDALEQRIQAAQTQIMELETELTTTFSARQIQSLQTEKSALEDLISNWQANYSELLRFLEGGASPNYLTIIEPAQLPGVPISPDVKVNVLLASVVGFALALGAAILLEYMDDTIKTADNLSETLGLTALGSIGRFDKDDKSPLITTTSPFSPISEAYRMLRSNIQFMAADHSTKSIVITSDRPGVGKSITAANLAVVLAQADLRTIIIDADLRRPTLHKLFGISNSTGLTNLLYSPEPMQDQASFSGMGSDRFQPALAGPGKAVNSYPKTSAGIAIGIDRHLKATKLNNLQIITSGPLPSNPAELLNSKRMAELLKYLGEIADIIILDTPPALAATDAVALSGHVEVGGVLLIFKAGYTRPNQARRAIKSLQQVGANILGGVINGVSRGRQEDFYHYYTTTNGRDPFSGFIDSPQPRRRQRLPFLKR